MHESTGWSTFVTHGFGPKAVQAAIVMGWRLAIVFHICWACGWLAFAGLGAGFARADDDTRVEFLEARMFDLRIEQCKAMDEERSAQVYTIQLGELRKKYYKMTGRYLELPTCQELK